MLRIFLVLTVLSIIAATFGLQDLALSFLGFIALSTIGLAVGFFLFFLFIQIKRKGYKPPFAALVLALGFGIGIALAVPLLPSEEPPNSTYVVFLSMLFSLLLSGPTTAIIVLLLPKKQARAFGRRKTRIPFARVGLAIIVVGLLAILHALYRWAFLDRGFQATLINIQNIVVVGAALSAYLFYLANRADPPSVAQVLATDKRPPALYLRAFDQESDYFVMGSQEEYGSYTTGWASLAPNYDGPIGVTLEQYLSGEISESIGPFVALGSPEDYLPPDGATRVYADDKNWMDHFKDLARRAVCILVEVGKSDNLQWEFEELKRMELQEKLFILTRSHQELRLRYEVRKTFELIWKIKGIGAVSWPEFANDLGKLGYELDRSDPGPGAVLTFDQQGKCIVLSSDAKTPTDYVLPIKKCVFDRKKVELEGS